MQLSFFSLHYSVDVMINIIENTPERIVIVIRGELDTLAAKSFAAELEPAMSDAGRRIILDFTELEYISSAGMRIILLLQKTASGKGGKVSIKGMSEDIRQIFRMTGFDQMIEIL